MNNLKDKILKEVREKAENMDEGALKEWLESMLSEMELLETRCGEINRILVERERKFLKRIIKHDEV